MPRSLRWVDELALEMIDELTRWARTCPLAVADAGYGDNALFRLELTRRSIPWVMAVKASTSAYPAGTVPELAERSGPRGRPSVPRYRQAPTSLAELAVAAGRRELHQVTWRHGTKNTGTNKTAAMKSRFLVLRVRPASRHIAPGEDGSLPEAWLIAEWPPAPRNPLTTGSQTCPPTHRPRPWSDWQKSAGASNTTTAN